MEEKATPVRRTSPPAATQEVEDRQEKFSNELLAPPRAAGGAESTMRSILTNFRTDLDDVLHRGPDSRENAGGIFTTFAMLMGNVAAAMAEAGQQAGIADSSSSQPQERDSQRLRERSFTGETSRSYIPEPPPTADVRQGRQMRQEQQHFDQGEQNNLRHGTRNVRLEEPLEVRGERQQGDRMSHPVPPRQREHDPWLDEDSDWEERTAAYQHDRRGDDSRHSIVRKLTFGSSARPNVQLTRSQPDFSHIRLNSLNLRSYFEFVEAIWEYEQKNSIDLPVAALLSKPVREALIARHPDQTRGNFYNLPTKNVLRLLQIELRPEGRLTFHKHLQANTFFPELPHGYRPDASNFKVFYNALLLYRFRFLRVFTILSDGNPHHNIPKCENKEGGLIKTFLDKIPFEYGQRLHREMPTTQYVYFEEYVEDFFRFVEQDRVNNRSASRTNDRFAPSKSTANTMAVTQRSNPSSYKAGDHRAGQQTHARGQFGRSPHPTTPLRRTPGSDQQPRRFSGQRVHMLQGSERGNALLDQDNRDFEEAHEDDAAEESMPAQIYDSADEEAATVLDEDSRQDEADIGYADDDDRLPHHPGSDLEFDLRLQQLTGQQGQSSSANARHGSSAPARPPIGFKKSPKGQQQGPFPRGCQILLFHGSCDKGSNCKYSHEPAVLSETVKVLSGILARSPYALPLAPRLGTEAQTKRLQLLRRDEQQESHVLGHLRIDPTGSVTPTAFPSLAREAHDSSEALNALNEVMQNETYKSAPETTIIKAVYCRGRAMLPRRSAFKHRNWSMPVPQVLFDTGAISGSYISERLVEQYLDVLYPHLHRASGSVKLAVEGIKVPIKHTLSLYMTFRSPSGRKHSGVVTFTVLPTLPDTDMIIGLPDILFTFGDMHKDMMDHAIDTLTSLPVPCVNDEPPRPGMWPAQVAHVQANSDPLMDPSLRYPWTITVDNDAPEEDECPLPSAFPTALHFMEMSHDQALEEFRSLFDTHVAPEFASATPIISLLQLKGAKVFVPSNWDGINGVEPLHLDWKPGLPESMKPRARPVNPKLFAAAKIEFHRLLGYFYRPSTSSIASCLVIAPKATAPFIRFCGDYVGVNRYISIGHYPIPHVQRSLEKIQRFYVFLDFDLVNAFHQIRLHPLTAARLSVQTPWGQVEPIFMPEGVGPASGHLQKVISSIFSDFEEWIIVIFDNLLVLATDYQDAYRKAEMILDRCIERNVYLKFSKTWLGFQQVNFFGYVCRHNKYELSDERKAAIKAMVFPKTLKQMQSFLGSALFFNSFVPHFSSLAAPLHDMVHKSFDWTDRSTWKLDYERIFERFKEALQEACALFYPDYTLPWRLRSDASKDGVGSALLQEYTPPTPPGSAAISEPVLQPIAFASAKFSPQAKNWTTIEQEGYGVFFGVKSFSYYLTCKDFVLETDHANLLWMEASAVPKIVRWRVYLQSFSFLIRHIPGKSNALADWLSRMHSTDLAPAVPSASTASLHALQRDRPSTEMRLLSRDNNKKRKSTVPSPSSSELIESSPKRNQSLTSSLSAPASEPLSPPLPVLGQDTDLEQQLDQLQPVTASDLELPLPAQTASDSGQLDYKLVIAKVHGGRMGHHGTRRTWKLLNDYFPGHRIPYRLVEEFISSCPACQKLRLGLIDTIQPLIKTLHPAHHRSAVGMDTLTITPVDLRGNKYLLVVVNHMTKYAYLYALHTHDARTVAECLFHYFCTFGLVDCIVSDPGSEFDNEVVKHINDWFGIRHRFSLVDRHESNGVEGTNKLLLRHLTLLVHDERIVSNWSAPHVLPLIQFFINSFPSSEAGVVPLHAHFGSDDATYMCLPENLTDSSRLPAFIRLLDESLRTVRAAARQHHDALMRERTQVTSSLLQNVFQPGDFVLFQTTSPGQMKDSKLSPAFSGPYKVTQQRGNDVECQHITLGTVKTFHVTRLKIFHGSYEDARHIALLDGDQHELESIIGYIGDPAKRLAMQFLARFKDGDEVWLPWSKDITDTTAFEDFCRTTPGLQLLVMTQADETKRKQSWHTDIDDNIWYPGRQVYCDLRTYGYGWYNSLSLPNLHTTIYLVPFTVGQFCGSARRAKKKVRLSCPLFNEVFTVDNVYLQLHTLTALPVGTTMSQIVIDRELCVRYRDILPAN